MIICAGSLFDFLLLEYGGHGVFDSVSDKSWPSIKPVRLAEECNIFDGVYWKYCFILFQIQIVLVILKLGFGPVFAFGS